MVKWFNKVGIICLLCLTACHPKTQPFVTQHDGRLWLDDSEYRYVGVNFWYGAILASTGEGGDRARLVRELDTLQSLGINNLRILVGADGKGNEPHQVRPCLQTAGGVYNDTLLDGLDYLLYEMGKREMKAVLYVNNAWGWSGGYSFYLQEAGEKPAPDMITEGYFPYIASAAAFATNGKAQQLYLDHLRFLLTRENAYTRAAYADDATIMAWQLCNEPRAFSDTLYEAMLDWIERAAALCKELDPNHLVSTGSEGIWGCDGREDIHRRMCENPNIDYITAHIWPVNWSWATPTTLHDSMPNVLRNSAQYLQQHIDLAAAIHKPLVIEEFGYPRDDYRFDREASVNDRNTFLQMVLDKAAASEHIAGINIWAWGGEAKPIHEMWQVGDPLAGDPPQEQQGLYSIFLSDQSTIELIQHYIP